MQRIDGAGTGFVDLIDSSLFLAKWLRRLAGGLILVVVVAIAVLAIRLAHGPIDVDRLRPYVEAALQPGDGSYKVEIGKTQIAWEGWLDGIRVRASEIKLSKTDGSELASVPIVTARVAIGGMIRGEIALKELTLRRPQLRLVRRSDGRIELGLMQRERGSSPMIAGLLSALARDRSDSDQGPLADLEVIRIEQGDLVVDDANLGREWQARTVEGSLTRDANGIDMRLSFDLVVENRTVHFSASGHHRRADGLLNLRLAFRDLAPTLFASARGPMRALAWFDTPFGGRVDLAMRDTGAVEGARFEINGTRGSLAIPGYYERPLVIEDFALSGGLSDAGRRLEIASFRIKTDGPTVTTSGTFSGDEESWNYGGSFSIATLAAADIGKYWPEGLKPSTRRWLMANIMAGFIDQLDLRVAMRKRPDKIEPLVVDHVWGTYRFRDVTIRYLQHLPPVTKMSGAASFDDKDLRFAIESGVTDNLRLMSGKVDILGLERPKEDVEIIASLEGKLPDFLRIIDRKPLAFSSAVGVSPVAVTGDAKATITVQFKLSNELTFDDVDIKADADLTKLAWRKGLFGLDIGDGRFKLGVSKAGMALAGDGKLGEESASINWQEAFGPAAAPRRTLDLKTRFRVETLSALGFDLRAHMGGSFGAELKISGTDDGRTTIDGVYDFQDTAFVTPSFRIEKPAGMPAMGRSLVQLQNQRVVAVPRFQLESPAINAAGSSTFHSDGVTIRTMEISRLVAGRTNLRASIRGERDGTKTVRIEGASIDVSSVLKSDIGEAKPSGLRLEARIGRAYMTADRFISDLAGDAFHDGQRWRRASFEGKVGQGSPLSLKLLENGSGRWLGIATRDAGAALRALDFADSVVGGELDFKASIDDHKKDDWFAGVAQMRNFRLAGEARLGRLVALAAFPNFAADAGVVFTEAYVPFRMRDGVFDLQEGQIQGPQLGITVRGRIDTRREEAQIDGTIVPLYLLNSMFGKIPVLGQVLVGERGGGLFAAKFSMTGDLARPQISVNPISFLTPGPLRRIFDLPGAAPAQAENAKPETEGRPSKATVPPLPPPVIFPPKTAPSWSEPPAAVPDGALSR